MADPHTRHARGLIVVIVLGVIFFALLTLVILNSGKQPPKPPAQSETLSPLPLRLRLRTLPSANAPAVATANNGDKLIVLEDRGAWVRVQNEEGLAGWAERKRRKRFCRDSLILSLGCATLRWSNSANFPMIRRLPPG